MPSTKKLRSSGIIVCVLTLAFLIVAVPRLLYPDLDHGDEWADAELLISGKNFVKFGFIQTRFLPFYETDIDTLGTPYTHYPALACVLSGVAQGIAGITSLRIYRGAALFVSLLAVICWCFSVSIYSRSRSAGFLCALFYLTNPYFIYGADGLGQLSYSEALRAGIVLVFLMTPGKGVSRRAAGILIWSLFFILSLFTFEYTVYLALFCILGRLFLKKGEESFSWPAVVFFCSAPVAGFLAHLAQNAWYFGGITRALEDFGKSAADRILHSADAPMSGFGLKVWWSEVIVRYVSGVMIFNLFVIGCLGFFAYLMYPALPSPRKKTVRALLRLLFVLIACGVTWYVLFPAHSFAHMYVPFLYRHIVPAAALGFSIVVLELFFFLKQRGVGAFWRIAVCCACVVLIGWNGISRSDLPLTGRGLTEARDFLLFKRDLLALKARSSSGDEIGVNYYRRPFISYYTDRRTFFFSDGRSLAQREKLPRYFLFFPFNHPATGELYAFLQQKYRVLFTSESRIFPVVFYELNS